MLAFPIFISLILFLLGSAVGSFLNVIIYRTVRDESWISGRSRCEFCSKKIHWYYNVPLLSYLMLQGKTKCCRKPLSISHPVIEFLTGSLFVWWYWGGSLFFRLTSQPFSTLQPIFWLAVGVLLVLIFFSDLLYTIIPDLAVAALLVISLIYRVVLTTSGVMDSRDLVLALISMVVSVGLFASLWKLTKGKGMGMGDVKLAAPLALLLGWPKILVGLFSSFILGAVVALGLMALGKKKFGQVVPFGPFLVLGTILALVWGESIFSWYVGLL